MVAYIKHSGDENMVHGIETITKLNDAAAKKAGKTTRTASDICYDRTLNKGAYKNNKTSEPFSLKMAESDKQVVGLRKSNAYSSSRCTEMISASDVSEQSESIDSVTENALVEARFHADDKKRVPYSSRSCSEPVPVHLIAQPVILYTGKPKY